MRIPSDIEILRELPVKVDLLLLRDRFSRYKNVNKKVFDLVHSGLLYAVRRGLFLNAHSDQYATTRTECVANGLYFPSYVSLEWALQEYGLLSERVHAITSVTTRRSVQFVTPQGTFSYEHLNKNRYAFGYAVRGEDLNSYFIASPPKALLDTINLRAKRITWSTSQDIETYIRDDLRFNIAHFFSLVTKTELMDLRLNYHRNSKEARILSWCIARIK